MNIQTSRAILMTVVLLLSAAPGALAQGLPPVPPEPKFDKSDPVKYGTSLAKYAEARDAGWIDSYSKSKMTLTDARGDSVTRETRQLILEGQDGDKSIARFMSPAEIRGVAALTHEHPGGTDDSWLYLPSSRRVRRISGANRTSSFQGTEFTYEDLSSIDPDDYTWKHLGDDKLTVDGKQVEVYKLEAKPTYKNTGYSKLEIYMSKKLWRPERTVYYDKAGRKLKTLTQSRWQHIHKRYWRATVLEMTNHQTHKKTVIASSALFLNMALYKGKNGKPRKNLTAAQFTRQALESK